MWNSPRFCFNSYLELDRRMRMRARCAAWQLWVSEKFSSLSVVNSKPGYIRNTPRAKSTPDRTDTGGCSEPPATAMKVFPSGSTSVCQWSAAASITVIGAVGCIWPNFWNPGQQQIAILCRCNNAFFVCCRIRSPDEVPRRNQAESFAAH